MALRTLGVDTGHLAQDVLVPNRVPSSYPRGIGWQLSKCWLAQTTEVAICTQPVANVLTLPVIFSLQIMSRSEDWGTVFMNI